MNWRLPLCWVLGLGLSVSMLGCDQGASTQGGANEAAESSEHDHSGHAGHGNTADPPSPGETELANYVPAPYPLDTCVVGEGDLEGMGGAVSLIHEGREVKFCCSGCEGEFNDDPDKFLAMIDQAVIDQQLGTYPLTTCLISGDELDDGATNYVYENRLIRLCCDMCIETFLKNPNAYLEKLNEAVIADQLPGYAMETCPIAGGPLGGMGDPVNMVVGDRLVRLCCSGCEDAVREDPAGTLAKIDEAGQAHDDEAEPADANETRQDATAQPQQQYTCAMHPDVRMPNADDKCPTCNMILIPTGHNDSNASSPAENNTPVQQAQTLEVGFGCATCIYDMEGVTGCVLAVEINGKHYLVDGVDIDDLGDAHAADGLCNAERQGTIIGSIEGDRFVATSASLTPPTPEHAEDHNASDNHPH